MGNRVNIESLSKLDLSRHFLTKGLKIRKKSLFRRMARAISCFFGKDIFDATAVAKNVQQLVERVNHEDPKQMLLAQQLTGKLAEKPIFSRTKELSNARFHLWLHNNSKHQKVFINQGEFVQQNNRKRGICYGWGVRVVSTLLKNPRVGMKKIGKTLCGKKDPEDSASFFNTNDIRFQDNYRKKGPQIGTGKNRFVRAPEAMLNEYGMMQTLTYGIGADFHPSITSQATLKFLYDQKEQPWLMSVVGGNLGHALVANCDRQGRWHLWDPNIGRWQFETFPLFRKAMQEYCEAWNIRTIRLNKFTLRSEAKK